MAFSPAESQASTPNWAKRSSNPSLFGPVQQADLLPGSADLQRAFGRFFGQQLAPIERKSATRRRQDSRHPKSVGDARKRPEQGCVRSNAHYAN